MFWSFWPRGMWDLSSPTRDRTRTPCIGRRSLNHWTSRDAPLPHIWLSCFSLCHTILPRWCCGYKGQSRGWTRGVSRWKVPGANITFPVRETRDSTPSQWSSPIAWSSSRPYTCIWGAEHTWGRVGDHRYGQCRNGITVNLEVAGLMPYEYVRSILVLPTLQCITDTLSCFILFIYI